MPVTWGSGLQAKAVGGLRPRNRWVPGAIRVLIYSCIEKDATTDDISHSSSRIPCSRRFNISNDAVDPRKHAPC